MGVSMYCFILLVSAARLSMAELNRRCTYGGFFSILNAALQKNFVGISSFTSQQFEAWNLSLFLRSKESTHLSSCQLDIGSL